MVFRVLFAPVFATCVMGLVVAAVAWGRPQSRERWPSWPLWAVLLIAIGVALLLSSAGLGPSEWMSARTFEQVVGTAALATACAVAFTGTRLRRRAELLLSSAPRELDEVVNRLRGGERSAQGVFRGRIGADEDVTSPGGVVCAFYEAQLRQPTIDGRKGSLLGTERASPDTLWLRGERVQALVAFSIDDAFGPEETRKCQVAQRLAFDEGRAFADGELPTDAVSFEKLGRRGEHCLVVGELRPGPTEGSYLIRGAAGGPAMVVMADDVLAIARRVLRRSWVCFGIASVLCGAAAWLWA